MFWQHREVHDPPPQLLGGGRSGEHGQCKCQKSWRSFLLIQIHRSCCRRKRSFFIHWSFSNEYFCWKQTICRQKIIFLGPQASHNQNQRVICQLGKMYKISWETWMADQISWSVLLWDCAAIQLSSYLVSNKISPWDPGIFVLPCAGNLYFENFRNIYFPEVSLFCKMRQSIHDVTCMCMNFRSCWMPLLYYFLIIY